MSKRPRPEGDKPNSSPDKNRSAPLELGPEEKIYRQSAQSAEKERTEKKWLERVTLFVVTVYAGLTAVQSCQSIRSVEIAKNSLESAQQANKLLEQQLLPYIVVKQIDFTETITAGKPTPLKTAFINEGGSPAFEVRSQANIDRKEDDAKPDYIFHHPTGSTGTVGSKVPFDTPGNMSPLPEEVVDRINSGSIIIYVSGEISYSDFTRKRHHTFYCVQFQPSSGFFRTFGEGRSCCVDVGIESVFKPFGGHAVLADRSWRVRTSAV